MQRVKLKDRELPIYTKGEEIFNMTSHIVGGVLGIVAIVLCVVFAAVHHNVYGVISGAIYGTTMVLLYTMSSIHLFAYALLGSIMRLLVGAFLV